MLYATGQFSPTDLNFMQQGSFLLSTQADSACCRWFFHLVLSTEGGIALCNRAVLSSVRKLILRAAGGFFASCCPQRVGLLYATGQFCPIELNFIQQGSFVLQQGGVMLFNRIQFSPTDLNFMQKGSFLLSAQADSACCRWFFHLVLSTEGGTALCNRAALSDGA